LLAYQTAWFKAHYPHEFYAAAMCFDMHQSEKLAIFVDDMRRNGFAMAGPASTIPRPNSPSSAPRRLCGALCSGGHPQRGRKGDGAVVAEREANGRSRTSTICSPACLMVR
jgi:DNA polymerase-3 subunit alpha